MQTRSVRLPLLAILTLSAAAFLRTTLPPAATIEGLETAEGLEATLFASAPMVDNPIAMDVDARGRVWVTEGHNYRAANRTFNVPVKEEGDRIVILEDTDGDGKADSQKVYYQGSDVNAALGITVLGNQVIVSAYENVFLFTDTNGDDKPDEKRVLFKRKAANHDHTTHSFVFGPDGRLYFNAGNEGGPLMDPQGKVIVDRAGNAVTPDSGAYKQGLAFRLNRDFSGVEVIGQDFRNPFELALDSYGNIWQSDNDDDGNRSTRINYIVEYGSYGYRDAMTGAAWRTKRVGMESTIPAQHWHQNDPGTVPNLMITGAGSPTGMTVYEGDLLPAPFRNVLIHADAGPAVVRAYPATTSGAGFTAKVVNLLRSRTDPLFRPADVAPAPDGSLFVSDWYDQVVGGHAAQDFDQGRIIRLSPKGSTAYRVPRTDVSTAAGAIRALRSPAPAVRYLGFTKLSEMGAAAEPALRLLWADPNPRMRARALWLLASLPTGGGRYVAQALKDPNPDLRITGLRAARMVGRDLLNTIEPMAADPSPQVRREVALALRYQSGPQAAQIWTRLARQYDGNDRWYLEALGIAADGKWDTFLPVWRASLDQGWNTKAGREIVWRARSDAALPLLAQLARDPAITPAEREHYFRAMDFYRGPAREAALVSIIEAPGSTPETTALALAGLDSASIRMTPQLQAAVDRTLAATTGTQRFVDLATKFDARQQAPQLVRMALAMPDSSKGVDAARLAVRWGGVAPFRDAAFGADTTVGHAAVVVLSYLGGPQAQGVIEEVLLDRARPASLRRDAVLAFARLQAGGPPPAAAAGGAAPAALMGDRRLLQLVQTDQIPADLKDAAATVLFNSSRADVREGAAKLLPAPPTARMSDGRTLSPASELATRTGDPARGKAAFAKVCTACHQAQGVGVDFGPPLTEIGSKLRKPGLYTAILEPSAGIAYNYEGSTVRLKDGRETTGIVINDTPTEVAVKVIGGVVTRFTRAEVASVTPMPVSLMPRGLQSAFTEQELVDLVEYLASLRSPGQ
jgi:putative membrane-bound dehydrogenase-like protein